MCRSFFLFQQGVAPVHNPNRCWQIAWKSGMVATHVHMKSAPLVISGTHGIAPQGVILWYGGHLKKLHRFSEASLIYVGV